MSDSSEFSSAPKLAEDLAALTRVMMAPADSPHTQPAPQAPQAVEVEEFNENATPRDAERRAAKALLDELSFLDE